MNLQEDVYLKDIIKAFECLKDVKDSCFGNHLSDDYAEKIGLYKDAYKALNLKVSPKVHALVNHVTDFFEVFANTYPGCGLGFWSEQASESVHYSFQSHWEKGYKVNFHHPLYKDKLLKAVVSYNSRHTFFVEQ